MPQSSRTMVIFCACCSQRAASGFFPAWNATAAVAAATARSANRKRSRLRIGLRSIVARGATRRLFATLRRPPCRDRILRDHPRILPRRESLGMPQVLEELIRDLREVRLVADAVRVGDRHAELTA